MQLSAGEFSGNSFLLEPFAGVRSREAGNRNGPSSGGFGGIGWKQAAGLPWRQNGSTRLEAIAA
jgi:hypothetical protein